MKNLRKKIGWGLVTLGFATFAGGVGTMGYYDNTARGLKKDHTLAKYNLLKSELNYLKTEYSNNFSLEDLMDTEQKGPEAVRTYLDKIVDYKEQISQVKEELNNESKRPDVDAMLKDITRRDANSGKSLAVGLSGVLAIPVGVLLATRRRNKENE